MRWCFFGLCWLLFPYSVNAAVYISEVAWMGSDSSANHEWIELHNDGDAVSVADWVLTDGANLSIKLSGVLPKESYAVLERTSDESASGDAFLIYSGALVNTGATLKLVRADGTLVDQVSGGADWENIGGDNTTKETAQYTSAGWKTAIATPGEGLVWTGDERVAVSTTAKTSGSPKLAKPVSTETAPLTLPDVTLQLKISSQDIGYVNQPIKFFIKPSGIGDTLIDSLNYEWNFGDGSISSQKEPTHIFSYPGTYVVTVYAGFKRQEQVTRKEITILPVAVSLTTNKIGDVQINNDSPYEIDISNYKLKGEKTFVFPPRTILLPNQTITIPNNKIGNTGDFLVSIYDTEGALLNSLVPSQLLPNDTSAVIGFEKPTPQISSISTSRQSSNNSSEQKFTFVSKDNITEVGESELLTEEDIVYREENRPTNQVANISSASNQSTNRWPYLAMFGVLLLGTIGVYIKPKSNENV